MYIIETCCAPVYHKLLSAARSATTFDVVALFAVVLTSRSVLRIARRKLKTTSLRGPPRASLIYGAARETLRANNSGLMYETWAKEYGVAYEFPIALGRVRIMVCDPRAIAHLYAKDTWAYVRTEQGRRFYGRNFGRGILWSQGEDHRRQRKSLTPAFSHAAIRNITPIFYSSAHKTRAAWEALIEEAESDNAVIDVQSWMNHISLDSIGLACFSHDFGTLDGKPASVAKAFDAFGAQSNTSAFTAAVFLLGQVFSIFTYLPTSRDELYREMKAIMIDICNALLERTKMEKEQGALDGKEEKSIIGLLIKAEAASTELRVTREEVISQMRVLLLAGYETSSITLTWALLELAQNPDMQTKLREELLMSSGEPTLDQLSNNFPYLDAVVHETLRMYPPLPDWIRVAAEDDIIPLSEPVRTKSGEVVNNISIARGTLVGMSATSMNRSIAIRGPDAAEFRPERWLEEGCIPKKVEEIQGHRRLLTFGDGPRACLGKHFALAEIKVTLFVLVKNFVFAMKDGPDTKVEIGRGLLPRPKVAGEGGIRVPLRISRY